MPASFTDGEVNAIANLFFWEMMGPRALGRLKSLISYANSEDDNVPRPGAGIKATELAKNEEAPNSLRVFLRLFAQVDATRCPTSAYSRM